jgi:S-adenosylmethionine:tRNA ribosyltransferase-isomerase
VSGALAFTLTPGHEAGAPPEARGLARDEVRLMVARRGRAALVHDSFRSLPGHLRAGDLLVVNTSATLPAALPAGDLTLHLSTPAPGDPANWVVELRRGGARFRGASAGRRLALPAGGSAELLASYLSPGRLWIARLDLPAPLQDYLAEHGRPIAYGHLTHPRPLRDLQTIFADEPGSAEMPSAARPFTPRVLEALKARGRVIAVGTTVVRALETVAAADGRVEPGAGWTGLTITPERGVRAVDGLITGWHEPEASHLLLLEAVAGRELIERSSAAALAAGYRWHEFGDSHLILR